MDQGHEVVGIGRSHAISHELFSFIPCDLSKPEQWKSICFGSEEKEVMLINNAGVIGNIRRISDQETADIDEVITVNALTPMHLCHQFLRSFDPSFQLTIVNISSGAASRSIPSWASYCASKAALDRFSETLYLEEKEKGRDVRIYSLAPGVLDTAMQEKIRASGKNEFSSHDTFIELFRNKELISPKAAVGKLMRLLELPFEDRVIRSLREVE